MNTNHWRHTHPCDGRVTTKDHFTEAELLRLLPDADRAEETDVVARIPAVGRRVASGLTRREAAEHAGRAAWADPASPPNEGQAGKTSDTLGAWRALRQVTRGRGAPRTRRTCAW